MAVKVSSHEHGEERVWEETDARSEKDTGRYLRAGAERAFLVSGLAGDFALRSVTGAGADAAWSVLLESNRWEAGSSAKEHGRVVRLVVLSDSVGWKESVFAAIRAADALVFASEVTVDRVPGGASGAEDVFFEGWLVVIAGASRVCAEALAGGALKADGRAGCIPYRALLGSCGIDGHVSSGESFR